MRHDSRVSGARFARDETRILSWSYDGTLRLWDVATGRQIGPAMRHDAVVSGALLSARRDPHPVVVRRQHPAAVGRCNRRSDRAGDDASGSRLWRAADARRDPHPVVVRRQDPAPVGRGHRSSARTADDARYPCLRRVVHARRDAYPVAVVPDHAAVGCRDRTPTRTGDAALRQIFFSPAVLSRDETRILSWSRQTMRLWDVSWRGRSLQEIACNHSPPDHDIASLSARYGIKIDDPICEPEKAVVKP